MDQPESRRQAKRRETFERIAATGLRLFLADGYEATTIDAIAEASGISRRTFFYYFASKDDVLLAWSGAGKVSAAMAPAILQQPDTAMPLDAGRHCLIALAAQFETAESRAVDALMRSSEALRAQKEAVFADMESSLYEGFCTRWPDASRRAELRTAAMIVIGVLRLALEDWRDEESDRSLADCIADGFAVLNEIGRAAVAD